MATVHLPAPLRSLANGRSHVEAPGSTLAEVIDRLEEALPGIRSRLTENGRLRPGMAAFVDGRQVSGGLIAKVEEDSEVYFSPAISGGS